MSNRIFIISDTHFNHKKVCGMEPNSRPFASVQEHDAELVYRWNNTVRKNDTVWHLGDVLFGREGFESLRQLNGVKKLVMGNHTNTIFKIIYRILVRFMRWLRCADAYLLTFLSIRTSFTGLRQIFTVICTLQPLTILVTSMFAQSIQI